MQLQNDLMRVTLKPQGAEMTSWVVTGVDYLWQGDPTYWGRQAPILFPVVGRLLDEQLLHDGQLYPLSQHGFARDAQFTVEQHSDTEAVFHLADSPETRAHYPFAFGLTVRYRLIGTELAITYQVHNPGQETLPFSIGAHPAFRVPFAGGDFTDYTLDFGETRSLDRLLLDGPYVTGAYQPLGERRFLPLHHDLFNQDALIFEQVDYVAIRHVPSNRAIVMECPAFTHFGIWSPPQKQAPFVCLEPWFGHADYIGARKEFRQKESIQLLAPNETFEATYTLYVE